MSGKGRTPGNSQYEPCINCGLPLGKRNYTPRHACTHANEIEALRERAEKLADQVKSLGGIPCA